MDDLKDQSLKLIVKNFKDIKEENFNELWNLSMEDILLILSNENLNIDNEDQVLTVLINYIENNYKESQEEEKEEEKEEKENSFNNEESQLLQEKLKILK